MSDYFCSVFRPKNPVVLPVLGTPDLLITPEMVEMAFVDVNLHSAPGIDCIPMYFWKALLPVMKVPLSKLFSKFLNDAYVPVSWKCANIVPIYKGKGDQLDSSNYRPIS